MHTQVHITSVRLFAHLLNKPDPRIRVEFSFAEYIKVNCRNRVALIALTILWAA